MKAFLAATLACSILVTLPLPATATLKVNQAGSSRASRLASLLNISTDQSTTNTPPRVDTNDMAQTPLGLRIVAKVNSPDSWASWTQVRPATTSLPPREERAIRNSFQTSGNRTDNPRTTMGTRHNKTKPDDSDSPWAATERPIRSSSTRPFTSGMRIQTSKQTPKTMGNIGDRTVAAGLNIAADTGVGLQLDFPCTKTYISGRVVTVSQCGGESEAEVCCTFDEYKDDVDSCVASCVCSYSEDRTGEREVVIAEHPTLIRGVPIFLQYDAKDKSGNQPIGCGGIVVSMLASWFSARGYTKLTRSHESGGEIGWRSLTTKLAEDYLDTWIRNNASPTYVRKITPGIQDYWNDKGYNVDISKYTVKDGDEDAEFSRIKTSINNGRPVILGFDVDLNKGGGIGGGGDDFGFIDHYGLIVGYDDTGAKDIIYINMGWGDFTGKACDKNGDNCMDLLDGVIQTEFKVGKGKAHTWYVSMDASQKTKVDGVVDEQCPLPDPKGMFKPNKYDGVDIGATFATSLLPPKKVMIADSLCAVVGGEEVETETYAYTRKWKETYNCDSRYSIYDDVLGGTWEPEIHVFPEWPLDELDLAGEDVGRPELLG